MSAVVSAQRVLARIKHWPWQRIKQGLSLLFFVVVVALVFMKAREVAWGEVFTTFRATAPERLFKGFFLALICYGTYAGFELIGCYTFRIKVTYLRAWYSGWIS